MGGGWRCKVNGSRRLKVLGWGPDGEGWFHVTAKVSDCVGHYALEDAI